MFSQRLWIAAVVAGCAWLVPPVHAVHAQVGTGGTGGTSTTGGGIRVALVSIGGEEVTSVATVYVNRQQCLDNADMLFKVDYAPAGYPSMDIYKGERCNERGNRDNTTSTSCTFIDTAQTGGVTMGLMLHVDARDIIGDCNNPQESMLKLFFLAVTQKQSTEDVGNRWGPYNALLVDTTLPLPPVNVRGGEGENTIPVSWSGGQTNLKGFKVYIDPGAGEPGSSVASGTSGSGASGSGASGDQSVDDVDASIALDAGTGFDAGGSVIDNASLDAGVITSAPNPDCPSSVLVGGASAADLPSSVRKRTLDEPNATGTDLTPSQIGGTHAAIAVVAVDLAGNESAISNVECADVVVTTSFWDEYQANGGDAKDGCPCSAMGPVQIGNSWPVGLAVLALGLSARRRRSS